ncbi:DUF4238 domain-containing protein [Xanthobacteraceae bacterium A53D]
MSAWKRDPGALSFEQNVDIARFMVASRVRIPEHAHRMRTEGKAILEATLSQGDGEFDRINTGPAKTLLEWTLSRFPERVANFGIDQMPKVIEQGQALPTLLRMNWMLLDATAASLQVMISDRPLVAVEGIDHTNHVQAMPLGPRHILLACGNPEIMRRISTTPTREMVKRFNKDVISQARRFAYGEAKSGFVATHLPLAPTERVQRI